MRCPHCQYFTRTVAGWKVHVALSRKCLNIRQRQTDAQPQPQAEVSDAESLSSESSSSSSNSPLLPSRNPFFKFFKRNRKDRRPDLGASHSRTSLNSASTSTSESVDVPKGPIKDFHPTAADTYGRGKTILEEIHHSDQFAKQRNGNIYYPFVSKEDWEVAAWLIESGLSMAEIDKFLNLPFVSEMSSASL